MDKDKLLFGGETKEYTLSELFDLQMGKTPSRSNPEYWSDGEYKWISIADLTKAGKYISETKELLSEQAIKESGISIIPRNTVIMSFKLSIGKTSITAEDMFSNEAIMAFWDKHRIELMPEYVYYLLLAQRWDEGANKAVMGMTQNKATLSGRKVHIHSAKYQRNIVEKLNKVQDLIQLRKTQLSSLDTLIKARFVEMFGDPFTNPKGWVIKPLADVITNANNGMARRGNDEKGNIVLRLVELQDGYINYENPNRILLNDKEKQRYLLRDKDFLFARVNGNPLNVGRCAVFSEIGEDVYHNDHIIRVHFNEKLLDGCFASAMFNSDYGKSQMSNQIKTSAGQYTISQDGIGAIESMLPPIGLQHQFSDFVSQIDKSKAVVQKSLDELQTLFDSLMQEYFG